MRKMLATTAVLGSFALSAFALAAGPSGGFNRPDILGTDDPETMQGTVGSERVFALGGDDTADGGPGEDWVDGGRGKDKLNGASGNDLITGETCNAERCDPPESDVIHGGSGSDIIESNRCRTNVTPIECPDGNANDKLFGDDGDDEIYIFAPGKSSASGGDGDDEIYGSKSSDLLTGGTGRDVIRAGRGNDTISVKDGEVDTVNCGLGRDSVRADARDRLTGCEVVTPTRKKRS